MIAEALSDGGFHLGLVVFDGKQIISVSVRDRSTDLPLAEDRIASDDCPVQLETLEQRQCGRDLVLIRLDDEIADDGREFSGERRDHMQRFGV